jgi:hypothetical protein
MRILTLPRLSNSLVAIILLSFLLVGGLTYYILSSGSSPQASNTDTSPSIEPFEPGTQRILGTSFQPEDLNALKSQSVVVVMGTVTEVLPSVWTTNDGVVPSDIRQTFEKASAHIRTPFRLAVERVYKANEVPSILEFSVYGGTTKDFNLISEDLERLKAGATVIMFMREHPQFTNVSSRLYPNLFFVVEGNVASGPVRDIPLSELESQIQ